MRCLIALWLSALLTLVALPARAAVEVNDMTEITLDVFIPCAAGGAGELVELTGPLHTLISYTIAGKNVSGYFHFQPQGISGTGLTTGAKFQATGITQEGFHASFVNGQANITFINNFRIIGQGTGNNFLIHDLTINADGIVTIVHDNFSAECK
jgi:hypothetical protein